MGKEPQANKGEYIRQRNAINWNLLLWRFMTVAINPRLNSEYFDLFEFYFGFVSGFILEFIGIFYWDWNLLLRVKFKIGIHFGIYCNNFE